MTCTDSGDARRRGEARSAERRRRRDALDAVHGIAKESNT
jgi:hypothetical protein